jgi:hypothetical protein
MRASIRRHRPIRGLICALVLLPGLTACSPSKDQGDASESLNPAGVPGSGDPSGEPGSGSAVEIGSGEVPGRPLANVQFVRAVQVGETSWRFEITLMRSGSGDKGYIDGWDVLLPDNSVLTLAPDDKFTMALDRGPAAGESFESVQTGLEIPLEITDLRVRAHDSIEGFGGREVMVYLDMQSAPDFEVVHTW